MIILAAEVESVSTRRDKTVKLTFGTQELSPQHGGEILSLQNAVVYLAIKKESFTQHETDLLDKLKAAEFGGKTKSQRLRNVLYVNWQQDNKGFQSSDDYYDHMMEKIIEHYKSKLD